ncbi:Patatin family phospholipase [[Clostridium] ultunense Esp]|nr:Patatin family phospholipase [[Clostridium] ultunense Esp]
MLANGVFGGGGVKGIAFVGALKVCEEMGIEWNRLGGTSAGAIVSSLLAAGYRASDLEELMVQLDFSRIVERNFWDYLPLGRLVRMFFTLGMYPATYLEKWLEERLKEKGVSTFADLPAGRLTVIVSNLSTGEILALPQDLQRIGFSLHELKVSRAVRISSSMPFFFDPIKARRNPVEYLIDGGVLSNFPVWIFDQDPPHGIPTFGFSLSGGKDKEKRYHKIRTPISMLRALFSAMLETQDMKYVENQDAVRTIFIPTPGVQSTDFHLTREQKDSLLRIGEEATRKFFRKRSIQRPPSTIIYTKKEE